MNKNECFEETCLSKSDGFAELSKIAEYKDGWDKWGTCKAFSRFLIERCERILESLLVAPDIRPTIEYAIAFDFDCADVGVELSISDDKITGFVADPQDNTSVFSFNTELDAVNFWNTIVCPLYSYCV